MGRHIRRSGRSRLLGALVTATGVLSVIALVFLGVRADPAPATATPTASAGPAASDVAALGSEPIGALSARPKATPTPTPPAAPTPSASPSRSPEGASALVAVYKEETRWSGGYSGTVTITNRGSATVTGWRLVLTVPAGHDVWDVSGAEADTRGRTVTLTPESWTAKINTGRSVSVRLTVRGGAGAPSVTEVTAG
ncbi:cellulose binding domain-containing protein [Longispora sp. K20-0274]|uniref:cellulose binding domain-containing protein n=1 Tax=Longispora sp. K20-0274 TaxID=3088255 RepID=UPI003999BAB6